MGGGANLHFTPASNLTEVGKRRAVEQSYAERFKKKDQHKINQYNQWWPYMPLFMCKCQYYLCFRFA